MRLLEYEDLFRIHIFILGREELTRLTLIFPLQGSQYERVNVSVGGVLGIRYSISSCPVESRDLFNITRGTPPH